MKEIAEVRATVSNIEEAKAEENQVEKGDEEREVEKAETKPQQKV